VGCLYPACSDRIAAEAVSLDQVEDVVCRAAHQVDKPLSFLWAVFGHEIGWVIFQSWNNLSAIASGRAKADVACFKDGDAETGLGQMQRRGDAGESSANDRDVDVQIAFNGRQVACRLLALPPPKRSGEAFQATVHAELSC
jgi:hypothetical protein